MIAAYRRHSAKCPHFADGREYRRCKCPMWADGTDANGQDVRVSLHTRDWDEGIRKVNQMAAEKGGDVALATAWDSFLADKMTQNVAPVTIKKYKLLRKRMETFAKEHKLVNVRDFTLDMLTTFRVGWKWNPRTARAHLERLRTFFQFCADRHWADGNPARHLKAPKVADLPTLPLDQNEWTKVLTACDTYKENVGELGLLNALRLRALVMVMRYSGLRISDAVNLSTDQLKGDRLRLRTAKTGTTVSTILPGAVLAALEATPRASETRYFWTGNGKLETATKDYQAKVAKVFELAGVQCEGNMVSHRFRDTFAVEFLNTGGSIDDLSVLLGHSNTRVTSKHYAPWVKSRQNRLEEIMRASWKLDVSLAQTKGTKQVQTQSGRPN